ncbi:MAG: hypothetical protein HYZ25_21210 [Chloroflexi bacterium]|nr:hypothetical protein [Chloroflexota bacterium]
MKKQGSYRLFALMFVFVFVSLACYGGGTPTPAPIQQQQQSQPTPVPQQPTPVPQQDVQPTPEQQSSGGLTTFTDQNKYYAIDIPSDWAYSQTVDSEKNYYYIDTFTSPDQMALVENIVYDDGKPFAGNDKGKFALYLLNTFYSKTGKEGDIRVSDDRMMEDGSERLIWTSKAGGYSGISFLETRGTNTFLLFTVEWVNSAEDQYKSTLDDVIASYRVP